MLSRLSVRMIPDRRLRRLGSLHSSMDSTPRKETKAFLNHSLATAFAICTVVQPTATFFLEKGFGRANEVHGSSRTPLPLPIRAPGGRTTPITGTAAYAPFTPSHDGQHLPPPYYRDCWHEISRGILFRANHHFSRRKDGREGSGLTPLPPPSVGLRPEGLLLTSPTEQAGSSFRPLSKIPHCCPRGRNSFRFRCGGTFSQTRWGSSTRWAVNLSGNKKGHRHSNPGESRPLAYVLWTGGPF
jgi:hypothetical protein